MDVDEDHSVDPHGFKEPGHIGSRDGYSWCGFAILSCVSVVGDDDVDFFGAGSAHGGDHEEQLHEVLVDGGGGGLDNEDVFGTNVFVHLDAHLSVVESAHLDAPELYFEDLGYFLGQGFVRVP